MVGIKSRRAFQAEPRGGAGGVLSTVVYWAPEQSRWMETMDVQQEQYKVFSKGTLGQVKNDPECHPRESLLDKP